MSKIIFAGGVLLAITVILIFTDFSLNPNSPETNMRSLDMNETPSKKSIVLHQTEVGNQYITPIKKSISNSNWQETYIAQERTISGNVEKNVSFEFYSEMPTPSQKVLDRFEKKATNPTVRKVPQWSESTSDLNPTLDGAINIDEFLDNEKKS